MKLVNLLADRHVKDVFVPECKNGPTHTASHKRLDAWVLMSSWAHPCVIGYECKMSRSDFLQDNKWPAYLPLCNQLYFVCPTGLIQPTELPPEVGLLWASKTFTKLYTKKKAPHRDVTIPEDVYRYVLMCRAAITRERGDRETDKEFWARWLEDREADKDFGRRVGGRIAKEHREKVLAVSSENERLTKLVQTYEAIRRMVTELGLNPDTVWEWRVRDEIEKARAAIPRSLLDELLKVEQAASAVRASLERIAN